MKVAVILPCYNEEGAIGKTVADFRAALPGADIYVYDNDSKDRTAAVAAKAGAIVAASRCRARAIVRRKFADVEADVYVMADGGDDTYEAGAARR